MARGQVSESGVAGGYANALFEVALETASIDEVERGLASYRELLDESADLRRLVASPVFSSNEQLNAISAVLERAGIGGFVASTIKVAARNRRLFATPDIITKFAELVARHRGEVAAEVTSAEPLSDAHVADLKAALKESLGKDVTLDARVDPGLIGGLTLKVGSRMIDGSLRTKLNSLKHAMKEVG